MDAKRLTVLSSLLKRKNEVEKEMAVIIRRPLEKGHFGEFVAAEIFGIDLCEDATNEGYDGVFRGGALDGKTLNIKYYTRHERLLDLKKEDGPDHYLVMTGPAAAPAASRGQTRPWVIVSVFVFEAAALLSELRKRNPRKRIGLATYVPADMWDEVKVYPCDSAFPPLTRSQKDLLELFRESAVG